MKKFITLSIVLLSICLFSAIPPKKERYLLPKSWVKIPVGKVLIENKEQILSEFYILETEISNLHYLEFLSDFQKNHSKEEYQKVLPDTTKWTTETAQTKEFTNQYFRYLGFRNFPTVGVSHHGAEMYCDWVEKKLNERFNTNKIEVRLPTEAEWVRAARGDSDAEFAINTQSRKAGMNYRKSESNKNYNIITMDIFSFAPNIFGLYNMSGNVAEMISEEGKTKGGSWNSTENLVKIDAIEKYTAPSVFVGFRPVLSINE